MKKNIALIAFSVAAGCLFVFCLTYQKTLSLLHLPHKQLSSAPADAFDGIDQLVQQAIQEKSLPGAVVLVGHNGHVVYKKSFGYRMLTPHKRPMTPDTIFDIASITKPIITATSIMQLVEKGKLSLQDTVTKFLPSFAHNNKQDITIYHLMTHTSGLPPATKMEYYGLEPDALIRHLCRLKLRYKPGTHFAYGDTGYILLGKIVEIVSKKALHNYVIENIFTPLGMHHSYFNPHPLLWPLIAPNDYRDNNIILGQVHDERAFLMGGVAGHAGMFSTADDLAIFCQMLLNKGTYKNCKILSEKSVGIMTSSTYQAEDVQFGLGWDIKTKHSFPRSKHFSAKSFGHVGFTGTSVWLDPGTQTFVIFLSNHHHPEGKGKTVSLRHEVNSVVAKIFAKQHKQV